MAVKSTSASWKKLSSRISSIDAQMNDIYKHTYSNDMSVSNSQSNIKNGIIDSIDKMVSNSSDINGIPAMTSLYNKLGMEDGRRQLDPMLMTKLNDQDNIVGNVDMISRTQSVRLVDEQMDMIFKYMPKCLDALTIKRDNVLSADNFTKDFIAVQQNSSVNNDQNNSYNTNCDKIKKAYKLQEFTKKIELDTYKYGEAFIYCAPYKKAIAQLLRRKKMMGNNAIRYESSSIIFENGNAYDDNGVKSGIANWAGISKPNEKTNFGSPTLKLEISSGVLEDVVESYGLYDREKEKLPVGIYESMMHDIVESNDILKEDNALYEQYLNEKSGIFDKVVPDSLDYKRDDIKSSDGLMDSRFNDNSLEEIKVPGCVLKQLKRSNVVPFYIEQICLGYFYIDYVPTNSSLSSSSINMFKDSMFAGATNGLDTRPNDEDMVVRKIAANISDKLTASFINKNADLSEEIYAILKYNEKFGASGMDGTIKATFLPADDVIHHYYNFDEETHRGIADMHKGLIPAICWSMITLCISLGIMTRSQDKRIYYVQTTDVDTNISKTLMSVVNQLKKGNFGIRQMESMNNVLGILGQFNDHIVPKGPNGEAPVQFETMQGQQFEIPVDLLTSLEENAINSTDVPIEVVNSYKQLDFAIHYNQSNARFLSIVYERQDKAQNLLGLLFTKIYNCEYEDNITIKVNLPAPQTLPVSQTSQQFEQVSAMAESIVTTLYPEYTDEEKAKLKGKIVRHHLAGHLNINAYDRMANESRIEVALKKQNSDQEQQ